MKNSMNVSVKLLYQALLKRNIDVEAVPHGSGTLLLFEYEGRRRSIRGTTPDLTSAVGQAIAHSKYASSVLADAIGVRAPVTLLYESSEEARRFLAEYKEVVVKPLDASHGNGVTVDVTTMDELSQATGRAREYSDQIVLQEMVQGADIRVFVVDGEMAAASERVPAEVVGDGIHTLEQLIEKENTSPNRGEYYEKPLNRISLDQVEQFVGLASLGQIPEEGEVVQVVGMANIGSGGTAIDRTGQLPEGLIKDATRFAKAAGLFVCGVDFMYDDVSGTWNFIEANASPSFGLHIWPSEGKSVDVVTPFIDKMLATA